MRRFNDDGRINQEWLGGLSWGQMADWLTNVIFEREPALPDDSRDGFLYLAESYKDLSSNIQEVFRDALLTLLIDMNINITSCWRCEPIMADRLIYLAGDVFTQGEYDIPTAATELMKYMAEDEKWIGFGAEVGVDIHGRLLQALMTIDIYMPYSFWEKQAKCNPESYLGVAIGGVDNGWSNPLELLRYATEDMSEETRSEIEEVLDILCIEKGKETFGYLVRWLRVDIPDWCKALLAECKNS